MRVLSPLRILAFIALSAAGLALVLWGSHPAPKPVRARLDFTLKNLAGQDVSLADFKGRPVLINFWETFCVPCQFETPDLVDAYAKYKDRDLVMIGISMHDEPADVKAYIAKYKMTYPVLIGGERDDLANAFAIMGFPTTWFIRRDGTISAVELGMLKAETIDQRIREIVGAS